jgi:serine protease Do/serine protease DegQ
VEKIHTASYGFRAGLQPGDLIIGANRRETQNISELRVALKGAREVLLNVQRGGQAFLVVLR